ncbi:uncharacterized protein EMH_0012400 [Eimeria mitis]|uniref:Uncharacterized protein n=1 Tax=Eimeria mitis TaxID=44415 RepID=U6K8A8_9EIME|nr:uncharacterized protein EMH_0012400 [Eimeria mitis]CDJ32417.1 hypothetical protein EMH_0012400 [Eimeria mitis]
MCAVATGPNPIPVSPYWSKKLPGREEKENAKGPDLGENQQPLAIQSHAGTTLLIEEGHTSKRDHRSELHSDAGMRETIGHAALSPEVATARDPPAVPLPDGAGCRREAFVGNRFTRGRISQSGDCPQRRVAGRSEGDLTQDTSVVLPPWRLPSA